MPRPWRILGAALCVAVSIGLSLSWSGAYLDSSEPLHVTMHFVVPEKAPVVEMPAKPVPPQVKIHVIPTPTSVVVPPVSSDPVPVPTEPTPEPTEVPTASPTSPDSTPSS